MKDLIAKLQLDANCALGAIWMHIDAQAARIAELEAQIAAASAPVVEQQPFGRFMTKKEFDGSNWTYQVRPDDPDGFDLYAASTALQAPVREVPERNAVIVVKPWQERCSGFAKRYMTELAQKAIQDEITELRAALAERNQP